MNSQDPAWRHPARTVACGLGVGILLDSLVDVSASAWWVVGFVATAIAFCARRRTAGAALLLIASIAIGGVRHHLFWSTTESNDVLVFAGDKPKLCKLIGRVDSQVRRYAAPSVDEFSTYTTDEVFGCTFHCESLELMGETVPVAGRVQLFVEGEVPSRIGERFSVLGRLQLPSKPATFGGYDAARSLRRQRVTAVVRCEREGFVQLADASQMTWLLRARRFLAETQQRAERGLRDRLDAEVLPVATAMLLGSRSELKNETRDQFVKSGAMHLLAISGLHVGILATFLFLLCRIGGLAAQATSIAILVGVLSYALITDARPSVVRATILVILLVLGRPWQRSARMENSLSIAAIALLLWNPTDLFDVGAQLSFLAVMGIAWSYKQTRVVDDSQTPTARSLGQTDLQTMAAKLWHWLMEFYRMVFGIWLFTTPLVAWAFNLVAPIGLLVNVVLVPGIVVILWCGYLLLFSIFAVPWIAAVFAAPFQWGLQALLGIVVAAADFSLGHLYVPNIPMWWLVGYYVLLLLLVGTRFRWQIQRWCVRGLLTWVAFGLSVGLMPRQLDGVRYTFLSVGQGLSVLIECPNGQTFLYDAGSIPNRRRASGAVQELLWERGITHLDAVIVSHADVDHFNGMPKVLENVPTGCLLIARSFLDFQQPATRRLCDIATEQRVPVRLLERHDRIQTSDDLQIVVLHPSGNPHLASDQDNANSLILAFDYSGRRMLLTGDIEFEGLHRLLEQPSVKRDVLLAPHHGSRGANPPVLNAWASPDIVVQSGGRPGTYDHVRSIYKTAKVLNTRDSGTITITITANGRITINEFRE